VADVLIIDDDEGMSYTLTRMVEETGNIPTAVLTLAEGLKKAASKTFDVVLLDVHLPDGNGLTIIPKLKELPAPPEIIIITAYGEPCGAELAIKSGVWDYIEKPASINQMQLPLLRALQYSRQKQPLKPPPFNREGIIGSSPQIALCIDRMYQAAGSTANVLILGETRTGKELFARKIHENSSRSKAPFVTVDCTNLPENLIESILFGHAKGAFTGADSEQIGLIKQADQGTLFLDEVGELPLVLQKRFLRVLQEHTYLPVGKKTEEKSDFRLIVATNRHLDEMVHEGLFRNDLLYRIQTLTIELPPLRNRDQDIKELINHLIEKFSKQYGITFKDYSPEFIEILCQYDWPGNIRELVNTIESSLHAAADSPLMYPTHLPDQVRIKIKSDAMPDNDLPRDDSLPEYKSINDIPRLTTLVEDVKKKYLQNLMVTTKGDMQLACRISGLSRSGLYDYIKKFGIIRNR